VYAADTENDPLANSAPAISTKSTDKTDAKMAARLQSIYGEIENLQSLEVAVSNGVISVSGEVANEAQAQDALRLANRMEGAVTVNDNIERTLSVQQNLSPILAYLRETGSAWLRAAPLALVALVLFAAIAYAGHRFASWRAIWQRILPNPFLADLAGQALRVVAVLFGLLLALNLLGATALIGTILGGAGVLGLAIGFAVRDSMENYIASIMLSVRQPFRADEHVIINDHEGLVVRLTSRATILMTLDGNHLRIPNSEVFKATRLNYTGNPQRRFEF
jgi:small-conductance mechanosensitive channel